MDEIDRFEEDSHEAPVAGDGFVVDLDGYEGPIDVLLALARNQKVDLARISILQLAEHYLAFITQARRQSTRRHASRRIDGRGRHGRAEGVAPD